MILLFIFVNANKVKQSKEMASYLTMTKAAIALAGVLACKNFIHLMLAGTPTSAIRHSKFKSPDYKFLTAVLNCLPRSS
jgi:hypothetical protein